MCDRERILLDRIHELEQALECARIGIADQWKRDIAVGTPLRDASIAVDAAFRDKEVTEVKTGLISY